LTPYLNSFFVFVLLHILGGLARMGGVKTANVLARNGSEFLAVIPALANE